MQIKSIVSSAVIGLAAVSIAAPLLSERGVVTIGGGQNNGEPDTPDPVISTTASISPTSATSAIPTPTMDNGQWHKQMDVKPDDGMYNSTKYDNSGNFDDGKYHPSQTASTTGAAVTLNPTSTALPTLEPSSDSVGNGTQVSGGISIAQPDHDPNDKSKPGKSHEKHCFFNIFCF